MIRYMIIMGATVIVIAAIKSAYWVACSPWNAIRPFWIGIYEYTLLQCN